jgi:hypothetical protein
MLPASHRLLLIALALTSSIYPTRTSPTCRCQYLASAARQLLLDNDTIDIGKYKIKYTDEVGDAPGPVTNLNAAIKLVSGPAAGRQVPLVKVVTTFGKPGVAVVAITKKPRGFVVTHAEGAKVPSVNGAPLGADPVALKNGDLLELAGPQMQFVQA